MKTTLRTIQKPINDFMPGTAKFVQEQLRPQKLMRKMVGNSDFQKFKSIQRQADRGDVRFNFMFPEETPDIIHLSIAERTNPTSTDVLTVLSNIFKSPKNRESLPTMSTKEFNTFFKNILKGVFLPNKAPKYPVKQIDFNPAEPYAEKISCALREFANERIF